MSIVQTGHPSGARPAAQVREGEMIPAREGEDTPEHDEGVGDDQAG